MRSFVLQTSDSDIQNGEVLGRLGFAANEADTGDARAISAIVFAMAEEPFTSTSNPTSIVFATALDGDATNKLKITSSGNFLPVASGLYDLGSSSLSFKGVYADHVIESGKPVVITDTDIAAGSDIVKNIVSLTNAEYNATTPDDDTAYIITDISSGTDGTGTKVGYRMPTGIRLQGEILMVAEVGIKCVRGRNLIFIRPSHK